MNDEPSAQSTGGEVFVLEYWYLRSFLRKPFPTLEEALDFAAGDCSPDRIIAPNGDALDPYTGEKREVLR